MPCLLSSSRMPSPSMNSKAMLAVLGRRLRVSPVAKARGTWARMPRFEPVAQALDLGVLVGHVLPWPVRRRRRGRRWRPSSRCRRAGRAPGGRRAAAGGSACRAADRARRCPWARAACGRTARACRSCVFFRSMAHLADRLHRVGVEHDARPRAPSRPSARPGRSCRFRCSPTSPRRSRRAALSSDLVFVEVEPAVLVHAAGDGRRSPPSPGSSQSVRMAGCSTAVVMIWLRSGWAFSAERMAVESDSVPQEVKTISESCAAPSSACTCSARFLERQADLVAEAVHRRGIAELLGEEGQHGLDHGRIAGASWRCCRVDRFHGSAPQMRPGAGSRGDRQHVHQSRPALRPACCWMPPSVAASIRQPCAGAGAA